MGLQSVLKDRARCLREIRTGEKVEGQPVVQTVASEWFKCRLEIADVSERNDDGRWRRVAHSWLVLGKHDVHQQPVQVLAGDLLQVQSDDIDVGEDQIWRINGDVIPMRRRSGILGYEFRVEQEREAPTWVRKLLTT